MWRILFIVHLVPLVLVELFVCRKYSKNRPNWRQIGHMEQLDVTGGRVSCSRANKKHPFKSVWSTDKIWCRWIHGPIVIDLGGFHHLTNWHTYQISTCAAFTTDLEEQPCHYYAEAVHPRDNRCHPCAARRPRSSTDLPAAYKYPLCLSTL
jgi:hypothetical protein